MSSSEQKPSGFTVTDRRTLSTEGEARPAEAPPPTPSASAEATDESDPDMPPADFGTLVVGLASSAVMHLGEVVEPGAEKAEKDLPMAKHTIDLLSMLQAKTKGNLSPQEDKLLESLLYDLRIRYVDASKS